MECDLGSCFPHQFNRIVDPSLIDELIIKIDDLECAFKANLCEACKRCCTPPSRAPVTPLTRPGCPHRKCVMVGVSEGEWTEGVGGHCNIIEIGTVIIPMHSLYTGYFDQLMVSY